MVTYIARLYTLGGLTDEGSSNDTLDRPLRKLDILNILKDGASLFSGDATSYEFTAIPGQQRCLFISILSDCFS